MPATAPSSPGTKVKAAARVRHGGNAFAAAYGLIYSVATRRRHVSLVPPKRLLGNRNATARRRRRSRPQPPARHRPDGPPLGRRPPLRRRGGALPGRDRAL